MSPPNMATGDIVTVSFLNYYYLMGVGWGKRANVVSAIKTAITEA